MLYILILNLEIYQIIEILNSNINKLIKFINIYIAYSFLYIE
jgi:hypothetical protein